MKVQPDEDEADTLAAALELLATREDVRVAMSEAARGLALREHDVGRVAEQYATALELSVGGAVVQEEILVDVARAAAAVGIGSDAPEATTIAHRLAEVELAE